MITRQELDESLERVMYSVLHEMKLFREHVDARFERIEARMDRQGGLIQSGGRALLRFDRWSDTADIRIADMSDHIQSLETRLLRLETRQ